MTQEERSLLLFLAHVVQARAILPEPSLGFEDDMTLLTHQTLNKLTRCVEDIQKVRGASER